MEAEQMSEYRHGRNYVRIGDIVKCRPLVGTSFKAPVTGIRRNAVGVVEITVVGGRQGYKAYRTFTPERIARVAQSRVVK